MPLIYSVFVPHPPIIVPEVGMGEEKACAATLQSFRKIAEKIVAMKADTVLLISPHAVLLHEGVTIVSDEIIRGNFAQFGAPSVSISYPNNPILVQALSDALPETVVHAAKLDHGALVPLYFLQEAGWQGRLVLMSMPMNNPEEYGVSIATVLKGFEEKIVLIASGDMSHRLKKEGPYGLHPSGPRFDQSIVQMLSHDASRIKDIPLKTAEEAGECGWRSLRLALAVKEGMPEVLSYEGPFGVGYLVAELYRSSPLPQWARLCLNNYLKTGKTTQLTLPNTVEFTSKRACFVTLKIHGELRGCIGTTEPWRENLALEIMHNAIAAAFQDPRFMPVQPGELESIEISVDVLGDMEKIETMAELDPWRYGVVLRARGRTGLLLPHLQGIDTAEEQVKIAKQKAGLPLSEPVEMWRFEVLRYFE